MRRRARSVAAGAGAVTVGALVALWCTRAELPPPLPEKAPAGDAVPRRRPSRGRRPTGARGDPHGAGPHARAACACSCAARSRTSWLGGPGTLTEHDGLMVVTRPLGDAGRAEVARAIGAQVRLQRADGGSCAAVVTGAVALARLDGGGEIDCDAGAEGVWEAADASRVIAGDLAIEGSCADALWASSASLPPPAMATIGEAPAEIRRDAIAALRARPEYRDLTDGSGSEEFEVSTLTTGGETVVVAKFLAETCTGQQPVLTGFWRAEAGAAALPGRRGARHRRPGRGRRRRRRSHGDPGRGRPARRRGAARRRAAATASSSARRSTSAAAAADRPPSRGGIRGCIRGCIRG